MIAMIIKKIIMIKIMMGMIIINQRKKILH